MVLGFLLSMLVHAALEIPALVMVERQLAAGESWLSEYWWLFHGIGGAVLSLSGVVFGFFLGRKYWRIIYIEQRRGTP